MELPFPTDIERLLARPESCQIEYREVKGEEAALIFMRWPLLREIHAAQPSKIEP